MTDADYISSLKWMQWLLFVKFDALRLFCSLKFMNFIFILQIWYLLDDGLERKMHCMKMTWISHIGKFSIVYFKPQEIYFQGAIENKIHKIFVIYFRTLDELRLVKLCKVTFWGEKLSSKFDSNNLIIFLRNSKSISCKNFMSCLLRIEMILFVCNIK